MADADKINHELHESTRMGLADAKLVFIRED